MNALRLFEKRKKGPHFNQRIHAMRVIEIFITFYLFPVAHRKRS